MQGYIIHINKVKDEDLIVSILTRDLLVDTYRFYGARHATINLGYKIDFEIQQSTRSNIAQLRGVIQLASKWYAQRDRMHIWQLFIPLFYKHLKGIDSIEPFYFDLLEECSEKWLLQNPKRVAIEAYIKLLGFEGRLHDDFTCFVCEQKIQENPAIVRGFLLGHEKCIYKNTFEAQAIQELFSHKSTLFFDDFDREKLWDIVLEGL
ncbi:MAG: recombination protein RecO [Sulfurospirillum sp.]|nr:recombination protein RecO [Sulfurospirillum sp.]